ILFVDWFFFLICRLVFQATWQTWQQLRSTCKLCLLHQLPVEDFLKPPDLGILIQIELNLSLLRNDELTICSYSKPT
ncbi:hypothetical protein GGR54DRAFT_619765, partial [Hypoxylon sp. NC1633]